MTSPRNRFRRLFHLGLRRADARATEVNDEIAFHLEERVDALIERGWSRDAALLEARRRFGDSSSARSALICAASERDRRLAWIEHVENILNDLKLSLRQLRHAPTFAFGVIAAIALGIGANATMFSVIDRLLLRPPADVVSPQNVFTFRRIGREQRGPALTLPAADRFRTLLAHDAAFTVASPAISLAISLGDESRPARAVFVDSMYFRILGVHAAVGRSIDERDSRATDVVPVAVISDALWQREFGSDRNVVGKDFKIGEERIRIIGVAPRDFNGVDLDPVDFWLPIPVAGRLGVMGPVWDKYASWVTPVVRIPGTTDPSRIGQMATALSRAIERERAKGDTTVRIQLQSILPSQAASLSPEATIAALLGAVSLVVLIVACSNAANLMLARAVRREREIAIRVALGVTRRRLAGQLMIDVVVLSAFGGSAAIGIAALGGAMMRRVLLQGLAWNGTLVDFRTLLFIAVVAIIAAALTSAIPALFLLRRTDIARALGSTSPRNAGRSPRRVTTSSLVIAQTALSTLLLIGALLFVQSLGNVEHVAVGMDADHLTFATLDPKRTRVNNEASTALFDNVAARASRLPGVASVAIVEGYPFGFYLSRRIAVPSMSPDLDWIQNGIALHAVTSNYFMTVGTRIVQGRGFDLSEDRDDGEPIALINATLATALWPSGNAVGSCIQVAAKAPETAPCRRIIGITEDTHHILTNDDPHQRSEMYVPLSQGVNMMQARAVAIRTTGPAAWVPRELRIAAREDESSTPVGDVFTIASKLDSQVRPWKLGATMFGAFGALAFILAALGAYSVIAYNVAQRTQEMGVRIALGARTRDILGLIGRQGATLGVAGVVIATFSAAALAPLVQPLLFHTSARSTVVYAGVGVAMLTVAVLASLIPAWRGSRVDPLAAIRAD